MDPHSYSDTASGHFVETPDGGYAFIPDPLPPGSLTWDTYLIRQLSDADRMLGELAGLSGLIPNPNLLVRPFIRREAVLSSRIEGTQASLSEVLAFEADQPPSPGQGNDVREVHNYVRALEYGLERLSQLPVSLRLIGELHKVLMQDVRGDWFHSGEFRRGQNFIGSPGASIQQASYVPPPPDQMLSALYQLEKYINEPSDLPPLIRLGLIHYQFEAIHPFEDGNGRLGRLLISLLVCAWNLIPQPLLYLSAYFEKMRSEYYSGLRSVSERGAWNAWLSYFLDGVTVQARDAIIRIRGLENLHQQYRFRLQSERAKSARLLQVVDLLFSQPIVTIRQVERELEVNYPTASRYIQDLLDAKIIEETTGGQRNRVFRATEILRAIEGPIAQNGSTG
jgi:Fic family protein